jgi:hypothetical protein
LCTFFPKEYEILSTNLQPFFWKKVHNIIKQNKKDALLQFLFGKGADNNLDNISSSPTFQQMDHKIQDLQNQVHSLQQKVIQLEAKFMTVEQNPKDALRGTLQAPEGTKTIHKGDSPLSLRETSPGSGKTNNGSYLPEKDPKRSSAVLSEVNFEMKKQRSEILESVSDASKIDSKTLSNAQQYNLYSNQEKGLHGSNFITLRQISEDEKIQIIQTGFQRQAEGIISLKKYYESTDPNSLIQLKGYSVKYETIRRTKLYQSLKE